MGGGVSLQAPAPGCVRAWKCLFSSPVSNHPTDCIWRPWNQIALSDSLLGQCLAGWLPPEQPIKETSFFVTLCLPHKSIPDLGCPTWVHSCVAPSVPGLGLEQQPASPPPLGRGSPSGCPGTLPSCSPFSLSPCLALGWKTHSAPDRAHCPEPQASAGAEMGQVPTSASRQHLQCRHLFQSLPLDQSDDVLVQSPIQTYCESLVWRDE